MIILPSSASSSCDHGLYELRGARLMNRSRVAARLAGGRDGGAGAARAPDCRSTRTIKGDASVVATAVPRTEDMDSPRAASCGAVAR